MRIRNLHSWDLTVAEAKALQARLASRVVAHTPEKLAPRLVAGADMSFMRGSKWMYGAVVVVKLPELELVEAQTARRRVSFPYVPGYLTFREGPVLLDCFRKLRACPDAVLFDGQGFSHPRRFGLASHLSVVLDMPGVGCAKSRLCGEYVEPGKERGARTRLCDAGACIGTVLRTRAGSKPLFVSVGHRISLADAEALVLACLKGPYRLPEPTRLAHLTVNQFRRMNEFKSHKVQRQKSEDSL